MKKRPLSSRNPLFPGASNVLRRQKGGNCPMNQVGKRGLMLRKGKASGVWEIIYNSGNTEAEAGGLPKGQTYFVFQSENLSEQQTQPNPTQTKPNSQQSCIQFMRTISSGNKTNRSFQPATPPGTVPKLDNSQRAHGGG